MDYSDAKAALIRAIYMGLTTEKEDPRLHTPDLTPRQIDWLAAWLAGEGFGPGNDPIETGREAALAQWHERWRQLRDTVEPHSAIGRLLTTLEANIPVGKALDLPHQEVMRRTAELLGFEPDNHHNALRCPYCTPADRVTFQLEPERVKRLIEVLRSAGAHPSGLGSYPAANDANMLADDIEVMVQR